MKYKSFIFPAFLVGKNEGNKFVRSRIHSTTAKLQNSAHPCSTGVPGISHNKTRIYATHRTLIFSAVVICRLNSNIGKGKSAVAEKKKSIKHLLGNERETGLNSGLIRKPQLHKAALSRVLYRSQIVLQYPSTYSCNNFPLKSIRTSVKNKTIQSNFKWIVYP